MGKTRAYGADCMLLAAFEASYGLAPADGYGRLSFKESSLGAERPLGYDPLLGQGRDAQDPFYEAIKDEGDIGVPLDVRALGFWLKGLFGAPATADNGDGSFDHVFTSGGTLPSLALEIGHAALATPKFFRHGGAKLDKLAFDMARSGAANASIGVIAQGESEAAATIDITPTSFALKRFSQGSGTIRVGGSQLANVVGGKLSFSNNLERVETIRADGLIDGVDETEATAEGSVDIRFGTDTTLTAAIAAESPVAMEYGFTIPGSAFALTFHLPRVFCPKKKQEIKGPGGIQASYDWRAARDPVAGYLLRVTLVNDVAGY
ncbi:phage tail tube protein [Magnetospirillum sp. 15-1]|uniref:phage tail tube protein n=1 Tax=Magnetospirillum sp. 15-1 TaxID=1979370 RepID=UPI000BBBD39F|nr:phage tail tube protein [Magnetospirillum sp. 15-1]